MGCSHSPLTVYAHDLYMQPGPGPGPGPGRACCGCPLVGVASRPLVTFAKKKKTKKQTNEAKATARTPQSLTAGIYLLFDYERIHVAPSPSSSPAAPQPLAPGCCAKHLTPEVSKTTLALLARLSASRFLCGDQFAKRYPSARLSENLLKSIKRKPPQLPLVVR